MWKRLILILFLAGATTRVSATDYTDIWWNPSESGWGVNFAQNENFIFATFFLYGPSGMPTWYTGQMNLDVNGNYTGPLYATTGPYYGVTPFDPRLVTITQVGNVTFQPGAADFGVLSYNVGGVFVSENIQRQTLTTISLVGSYRGGLTSDLSQCFNPAQNSASDLFADLDVSQTVAGQVLLNLRIQNGPACTFQGALSQFGQLYRVTNASYACNDGLQTAATLYELKATSQGIEGRWVADVGGGCREDAHFSAVLR